MLFIIPEQLDTTKLSQRSMNLTHADDAGQFSCLFKQETVQLIINGSLTKYKMFI